jgi:hypothetical protein
MINITKYIPHGKANAISKAGIIAAAARDGVKLEARTVRKRISEARMSGQVIVSTSDARGYFVPLPEETEAVQHYINESISRANVILQTTASAKQWLVSVRGQQSMTFDDNGQGKIAL